MSIDSTYEGSKSVNVGSTGVFKTLSNRRKSVSFRDFEPKPFSIPDIPSSEPNIPPPPEDEFEETIVALDGGYGWCIVFASFICNVVVDGILFSFGVLIDMIQKATKNEVNVSTIAWANSLAGGFHLSIGPLASVLCNRYGFRVVTIIGSLVTATSYICVWLICYLEGFPNMPALFVFYGLLGGIGLGLIYCPAILIVGIYFDKRRARATGIAVCGSGIGTFLFPPVINEIAVEYDWTATLLFEAVGVLLCGVVAVLYKPIKPTLVKKQKMSQGKEAEVKNALRNSFASPSGSIHGLLFLASQNKPRLLPRLGRRNAIKPTKSTESMFGHLNEKLQENNLQEQEGVKVRIGSFSSVSSASSLDLEKIPLAKKNLLKISSDLSINEIYIREPALFASDESISFKKTEGDKPEFGPTKNTVPPFVLGGNGKAIDVVKPNVTDIPPENNPENVAPEEKESFWPTCIHIMKSMVDLQVWSSPTFIILTLSGFLDLMAIGVPYMYLKTLTEETINATPSNGAYLLSAIGASNMLGRLFCGLIADHPSVNVIYLKFSALTIAALATGTMPLLREYYQYVIAACAFGFSLGSSSALNSVLLVELLGVEKLINAFGQKLLFQGIAQMLGPPLAGFVKEGTGSYAIPFYAAGATILLAVTLGFSLILVKKYEDRHSLEAKIEMTDCSINKRTEKS